MNIIKPIIQFILITAVISFLGWLIAITREQYIEWDNNVFTDPIFLLGIIIFFSSPIITGTWFYYRFKGALIANFTKMKDQTAELKQKNLLKRRFHGKRQLIDETDKHRTDLTRDLNKKTNKDKQEEILAEFFAGINLDMNAIKFPEAKEIVLEELKNKKTTK